MDFDIRDQLLSGGAGIIELRGEMDLHAAPELKERLLAMIENGATQIICDLSSATFIDSTTLGVLVLARKRLAPRDGALSVVCPNPAMAQVFELVGLDRIFQVHARLGDAFAALESAPQRARAGA
jgi:anti-sigma B factor antagonist